MKFQKKKISRWLNQLNFFRITKESTRTHKLSNKIIFCFFLSVLNEKPHRKNVFVHRCRHRNPCRDLIYLFLYFSNYCDIESQSFHLFISIFDLHLLFSLSILLFYRALTLSVCVLKVKITMRIERNDDEKKRNETKSNDTLSTVSDRNTFCALPDWSLMIMNTKFIKTRYIFVTQIHTHSNRQTRTG